jgi:hypothetical protein
MRNMKSLSFCALLILSFTVNLHAQQVLLSDVEKVAKNFYYERINQLQNIKLDDIKIKNYHLIRDNNSPIYYIFNIDPEGFVMISGYLNAFPVPAYSLTGSYAEESQPPQFIAWVRQYYDQINYARINKVEPLQEATLEWKRLLSDDPDKLLDLKNKKEASPMLISAWDQGQFFNQMCPVDPAGPAGHCLTGCVATAMGQLCYYFRWPQTGTGSYTYQHPTYGTITANFEDTEYKWDEMTNSVQEQNDAVAELLFHLGVSVDMDYGPSGSGMWNHKAAYSLRTYFKYSPETQYLFRDSTNLDWDSIIIAHLDQKIPMYYAGWSVPNVNGHAFIVDGYQTESYFHFNWGWGGSYDGYFYLDNLIPGGNNFNLAQELVINCYPDTLNYSYPYFCADADTLKYLNGTIDDGSGPTENYQNNANCAWLIAPQTEEDSVSSIILDFERFETELNHDIVTIYDGESSSSPVLGQFSGSSLPVNLNSTGNKLLVVFQSDYALTAPGWFISYSSITPTWCSGLTTFTTSLGDISDGSGSFNYHNSSACMWNIQPAGATEVTINFIEFDTETLKDIVKIYDAGSNQLLASYSGEYEPGYFPDPVTSPSGKMFVTFSSNSTVTKQGWSANYVSNAVGINDLVHQIETINVYPNPVKDFLSVKINLKEKQNVELDVYDIKGKLIDSELKSYPVGTKVEKIDISDFDNGIYTLRVLCKEEVFLQKIVIMN